jgi:hypothetical protein
MSFRDSALEEASSPGSKPEFHPFRDLAENIRANIDDRRQAPPLRFASWETRDAGGEQEQQQENERINERVLADPIIIKERNGAVSEIPALPGVDADRRLAGYLQLRGNQLTHLDLSGSSISDSGLALLSRAPNLARLLLNDTEITGESMKVLSRQGLPKLQELNISSSRVNDEGISFLKDMPLKVLNISDTATSDDCMRDIKSMRNLEVLIADYSGVGNAGVQALQEMTGLRSVSLKGCPITDACIRDLARCQNLMVLNLEDTQLSQSQVRWLQRQMPRCLIVPPEGQGGTQRMQQPQHKPFLRRLFDMPPRR